MFIEESEEIEAMEQHFVEAWTQGRTTLLR
jgi:hypothetical protein